MNIAQLTKKIKHLSKIVHLRLDAMSSENVRLKAIFFLLCALLPMLVLPARTAADSLSSTVTQIAAGQSHTVAVRSDGTLWAWGGNFWGQLGLGDKNDRNTPVQIGSDTNWVSVVVGADHTVAIRSDGTLWAWGLNSSGELGLGDTMNRNTPIQIGSDANWVFVAAGQFYTVAIRSDGTLWGWGSNMLGELGLGDTINRNTPIQIGSDTDWVSVAAGLYQTVAIKTGGTLWAWGYNVYGALGLGDTTQSNTPVQIGSDTNWVSIAAGDNHTMAIKTDGTLWGWGSNWYGRLGLGDTNDSNTPVQTGSDTNWVSVAAGRYHTVAIKTDGTLWAWGYNGDGQLGLGDDIMQNETPVQVGSDTDWVFVALGAEHTMAIKTDGTLWAWGYNGDGQLGLGNVDYSNTYIYTPIQVASEYTTEYTVTAVSGPDGSLDGTTPSPQTVLYNGTISFKFNANTGYHVAFVRGCGVNYTNSSNSVSAYTIIIGPITYDCAVGASFEANTVEPLTIAASTLPSGNLGFAYRGALTATGGVLPYSWSVSGTLPEGLTINGVTGEISGSPITAGRFDFTIQVRDAASSLATRNFSVVVEAIPIRYGDPGGAQFNYDNIIQSAYDHCASGYIIQIQSLDFTGDLVCDQSVVVTLQGGFDQTFTDNTSFTTINGSLMITNGTVVIENIIIQ